MHKSDLLQKHATAISIDDRGCLIIGASGSGKSTLAIAAIALGAELVADDRVDISRRGAQLLLSAPAKIAGLIEARGVGILRLPMRPEASLIFVVDLDRAASRRLPDPDHIALLGVPVPVLHGQDRPELASLLVLMLRHGMPIPPDTPPG